MTGTGAGGRTDQRLRLPLPAVLDAAVPVQDAQARGFRADMAHLCAFLDKSPTGRALLGDALASNLSLGLDPLLESSAGFYYPAQNHLDLGYLPAPLKRAEKGISQALAALVAGLRRAWHNRRAAAPDMDVHPADFIRLARYETADVEAVTHLVAWEMRAAGPCFFWRHLVSAGDGDIAPAFAGAALAHPRHQFDGTALRAAFSQWFCFAPRVDDADHQALERIDMALAQQARCSFALRLDTARIENLGSLPQRRNYLHGHSRRLAGDDLPMDPFNTAHLRHITADINYLFEKQR